MNTYTNEEAQIELYDDTVELMHNVLKTVQDLAHKINALNARGLKDLSPYQDMMIIQALAKRDPELLENICALIEKSEN